MRLSFSTPRSKFEIMFRAVCQMAVMYRNGVAVLIATAWLGQFVLCDSSRILGAEANDSWSVKDVSRTTTVLDATNQKFAKTGVSRRTTPGSFMLDAARDELLRPLISKVMSRLKYATFGHAPSEEELCHAWWGIDMEGQRGKYLLPTVILEDIRK